LHVIVGWTKVPLTSPLALAVVYFPGVLDDVRIYNPALSTLEVLLLYNCRRHQNGSPEQL
jgi:hypothetical protein